MSSFFVYLPSNVENDSSHENTLAHFVTPLCSNIIFEEEYEVALTEISYTYSWYNITEKQPVWISSVFSGSLFDKYFIEKGHYSRPEDLVLAVNNEMANFYEPMWVARLPRLRYDELTQRVIMVEGQLKQSGGIPLIIRVGEDIQKILGLLTFEEYIECMPESWKKPDVVSDQVLDFSELDIEKFANSIKDKTLAGDIKAGVSSLFIYSDIVEHSLVGNSLSQLLRIAPIPAEAKFGEQVVVRYERPNYIPVQAKELQKIEIVIKDDSGNIIPFNFGRTIVTLHFRKRKNE